MSAPTKKQQEVLEYIKDYIHKHKFSPTFEEIRKKFKLRALSGVHQHIQALVEKGLIVKNKNGARCLELKKGSPDIIEIPIM